MTSIGKHIHKYKNEKKIQGQRRLLDSSSPVVGQLLKKDKQQTGGYISSQISVNPIN
jgi:hypothetical protein